MLDPAAKIGGSHLSAGADHLASLTKLEVKFLKTFHVEHLWNTAQKIQVEAVPPKSLSPDEIMAHPLRTVAYEVLTGVSSTHGFLEK